MKITSYQLHHNIAQRVKIKFNFDKKIKPVKALRGVGGEKTVKPPTSSGSEMNCKRNLNGSGGRREIGILR